MNTTIARCIEVSETFVPGEGLRYHAKFSIRMGPPEGPGIPGQPFQVFCRGHLVLGLMKTRQYTLGTEYYMGFHPGDPMPLAGDGPEGAQQGHPDGSIDPDKSL